MYFLAVPIQNVIIIVVGFVYIIMLVDLCSQPANSTDWMSIVTTRLMLVLCGQVFWEFCFAYCDSGVLPQSQVAVIRKLR